MTRESQRTLMHRLNRGRLALKCAEGLLLDTRLRCCVCSKVEFRYCAIALLFLYRR